LKWDRTGLIEEISLIFAFFSASVFSFDLSRLYDELIYHPESPLLFSSGFFLFAFLGFLSVYYALRGRLRWRIVWATLFSLYFYYKCAGIFWLLHVVLVVVDFHLAQWMGRTENPARRKLLLVGSLVLNLGMLAYFKYTNYFAELWNGLSGAHWGPFDIILPVGISFFTFQSLSYTIDVYRRQLEPLRNIWDYAFFVTFFPQMVAGPIVRAADFLPQINRFPVVSKEAFGRGVFLFCCGLFKKAVVSDYISVNFVDRIFDDPARYTGLEVLFGVYGYALQIYCDFSGYSDMAIGLALLVGFQFPVNFDSPYQSRSVTEFWRRWHISLSTWLRDYLYIPLGGNRKGRVRTYVNLLLTMLLGGLWHGAATRFIIWGGLHGLALAAERALRELWPAPPGVVRRLLGGVLTFHFVCFCWVFFRAADLATVNTIFQQIAWSFQGQLFWEFVDGYAPVLFWMSLGYALHFLPTSWEQGAQKGVTALPLAGKAALVTLVVALVMQVKTADVQAFIYFQF
jgi:alginate O-acetyltransferase complex protein AlgI